MLESNHKLSIAIPLYNEEEVLPELLRRVRKVMDELPGGPHELICVDDGSSDRTYELVAEAAHEDSRVVLVSFSRNFGHQAAFSAALDHSTGDVVALMDGDLQDPPEELPKMLAKLAEGFDVVHAVRLKRKEGLLLRACYWLFYVLISKLAAIQLPRDSGDFCVMTRRVVREITCTPERHRYLRGLALDSNVLQYPGPHSAEDDVSRPTDDEPPTDWLTRPLCRCAHSAREHVLVSRQLQREPSRSQQRLW